jgi:ribonuclease BN (tRNA processing enzyme)
MLGHFSARYKDENLLVAEARTIFPTAEAAIETKTYPVGNE